MRGSRSCGARRSRDARSSSFAGGGGGACGGSGGGGGRARGGLGRRARRNPEERQRVALAADQDAVRGVAAAPNRAARLEPAQRRETQGHVRLRRLRSAGVLFGDEIRQQNRMAELLSTATERDRHRNRPPVAVAAHRGALQALWRTSGPRLRGWPTADWSAVLHEWGRLEVHPRRAGLSAI